MKHNAFMQLAIEFALKGKGKTSPNPCVGAVIVKNGRLIGRGYHKKAGMPHAEIEAINSVEDVSRLKGSAMYVTFEPCCHHGKTPPCTHAIIGAGIKEVYVAMKDPNLLVNGKGIRELEKAGIKVYVGMLEEEAKKVNEAFIKFITTGTPFIIQKSAMSLDGKICCNTGDSKWISSEQSRRYAHDLRGKADAVLVGINTVLKDNPRLTCRIKGGKDPLRIIVDSRLRIPLDANVLNDTNVLIATTDKADRKKKKELAERGIDVIEIRKDKVNRVDMRALMTELGKRETVSLLVEGGSEVNASLIQEGLVDKIIYFVAPKIIGGNGKGPVGGEGIENMKQALRIKSMDVNKIGEDIVIEGYT